jgi:hypothetical protein
MMLIFLLPSRNEHKSYNSLLANGRVNRLQTQSTSALRQRVDDELCVRQRRLVGGASTTRPCRFEVIQIIITIVVVV